MLWPRSPDFAPFDRIMVTAAAGKVPQAHLDQLAVGGILVLPIEERPGHQGLWRITRDAQGFSREHLLARVPTRWNHLVEKNSRKINCLSMIRFVPLVEGLPGEG